MALDLKANTAVDVLIGPFVDDSDGKTAETGLTLSQADIKLSKNGQALAQKNDITAATHDSDGYYNCELDATDTNTEGQLVLIVHESGALPVRHEFNVMAEAAWDSLYAAKDTGYMDVNVKAVSEDTAAADNLESACDNYSVTRGLAGTALPAAAADAAGGLPISDAGGLDMDAILADTNELQGDWANGGRLDLILDELTTQGDTNETKIDTIDGNVDTILVDTGTTLDNHLTDIKGTGFVKDTHSLVNIEGYADLIDDGTSGLAKIATDVAAILVDTAEIGTAGAGLTDLGGMSTGMKAEVEAECTDAIEADGLDHLVSAAVTGTDVANNSIIAKMVGDDATADWDSFDNTTDSLEALRNHIGDGTNLTEAGGDGDHLTEAGATGDHLTAVPWNAAWDAQVQSEVEDAIVDNNLDHLCKTATAAADMTAEVADNTILSRVLANGDTSAFTPSTDGLQLIRDEIAVNTIADISAGLPPVTPTLLEAIMYVYNYLRNKVTMGSGEINVFNAAGTGIYKHSSTDDGTTYTKDEATTV